jgi:hypothetical protein
LQGPAALPIEALDGPQVGGATPRKWNEADRLCHVANVPAALAADEGCRRVVSDTGIFARAQRFEHGQREPLAMDVDFAQQRLGMAMLEEGEGVAEACEAGVDR